MLALLCLSLVSAFPHIAFAYVVKYEITGTITNFPDNNDLVAGLLEPTDPFHLTATLDQSTKNPISTETALYSATVPQHTLAVQVGTIYGMWAGTRPIEGRVEDTSDLFTVGEFTGEPPAGSATGGSTLDPSFVLDGMNAGFHMRGADGSAWTSTDLPLSIDLLDFEYTSFAFIGVGYREGVDRGVFQMNGYITDVVTTVIPVPPALWLFGSGLLGLVGISRTKKK
jgi:hypothetical protein